MPPKPPSHSYSLSSLTPQSRHFHRIHPLHNYQNARPIHFLRKKSHFSNQSFSLLISQLIPHPSMPKLSTFLFFSVVVVIVFVSISPLSYGYDPLDPKGNITITWDFIADNDDTYDVRVWIHNWQLYRHVEKPGWRLSWAWRGDEVIWSMTGAEATEQGNCSRFKGQNNPHCCDKQPTIIDLMPGTPYNKQVPNCCKQGILSSLTQDPTQITSMFQMNYNKPSVPNPNNITVPANFSLGIPGYSCSEPTQVPPSKFTTDGRRWTQVFETWNVTCIYSQFLSSTAPKCCVSLSAFYSDTIVPCPKCSCNCQGLPGAYCVNSDKAPSLLKLPQDDSTQDTEPVVRCSQHMCPIRIHWHVKQSYTKYWRVKITITNYNFVKNYSQWNLVLLHPNLQSLTQVFSFNHQPLKIFGDINDTVMFWGVKYYNDMLLTHGENGNVQTEMLLHKDAGIFTFNGGWGFPRTVLFNGDDCVMPSPDNYPTLPNTASFPSSSSFLLFLSFIFSILLW